MRSIESETVEKNEPSVVNRIAHGVYAPSEGSSSALFDYELAAKVAPKGVFTLLSALRLHGLTDENPQRMTMAISVNRHPPNLEGLA